MAASLVSGLLTVQQVAKRYGIGRRTVWRWEATGRIPRGVRLGHLTVRWRAEDIEQHLASLVPSKPAPRPRKVSRRRAKR